jgi:hypothetical protein
MGTDADISELDPYAEALFRAIMSALPQWLSQRLAQIAGEQELPIDDVIRHTSELVSKQLAALLGTDVDEQRENPLHVLRSCMSVATHALATAGVPQAQRDEFEQRAMPNDVYAIGPLTWRDLSEDVHEAGITWGAWKAATVLTRRRAEGKVM